MTDLESVNSDLVATSGCGGITSLCFTAGGDLKLCADAEVLERDDLQTSTKFKTPESELILQAIEKRNWPKVSKYLNKNVLDTISYRIKACQESMEIREDWVEIQNLLKYYKITSQKEMPKTEEEWEDLYIFMEEHLNWVFSRDNQAWIQILTHSKGKTEAAKGKFWEKDMDDDDNESKSSYKSLLKNMSNGETVDSTPFALYTEFSKKRSLFSDRNQSFTVLSEKLQAEQKEIKEKKPIPAKRQPKPTGKNDSNLKASKDDQKTVGEASTDDESWGSDSSSEFDESVQHNQESWVSQLKPKEWSISLPSMPRSMKEFEVMFETLGTKISSI